MGNKGGIPFLKKDKVGRLDFHKQKPSLCTSCTSSHGGEEEVYR
ncbi:hypothetical protein [Bacteroides congonensis]